MAHAGPRSGVSLPSLELLPCATLATMPLCWHGCKNLDAAIASLSRLPPKAAICSILIAPSEHFTLWALNYKYTGAAITTRN